VRDFTEALKVSFIAPTHLGSASQNSSSYITSTSDCKFPQIFCPVSICCICFTGFLKRFNFSGHCGHFSFNNWLVIFLRTSENTFFKFFCVSSFVILNRLQILCALYMYVPLLYGNFSLMSLFLLSYRFFRMVGFGEEIQKANRSIARVSG
jgi:uncharacterized membrane protein